MKLNRATVGALWRAELRMVLRDRRSIITAVVLPLLIMPVMLFGASWMNRTRAKALQTSISRYALIGSQAELIRAAIASTHERRTAAAPADQSASAFPFEEVVSATPGDALARGDIRFYLEAMTVDEARAHGEPTSEPAAAPPDESNTRPDEEPEAATENWREPLVPGAPVLRLVFRADRDDSASAMRRMSEALRETRRLQREGLLTAHDFPLPPKELAAVETQNLASAGQVAGLTLGRLITVFVLLFILSGSAMVATDSIAGEKERGTLETLLTTAASRVEIVTAKHLAILTIAIGITLIQAGNLLVYVGLKVIPVPAGFAAAVPPGVALLLALLFLPLAALSASVLLLTSGYAKSYKEAQLYFLPVFLLAILPALAPFLPGLPLRSAIVLVPIANIAVAARDILVGHFDWPLIIVAWLVTAAAAVATTRLSVRLLSTEKLITASDTDEVDFAGGQALLGRHVLRWFAIVWALLLIIGNYTATLDLRMQAVINIVGLFFGASVLMLRRYRLDVRTALALRTPRPLTWLAVAFGVPGGLLAGIGLMQVVNLVLPMPPRMLEEFGRAMTPTDIPFWQIFVFFAVLPGVFEEITFRGVLLHGLHRRLHPAALTLVVGLVFGLFHVALFRIAPTAFLGVLFTAAVLLTGSIHTTIVWHALHNALSFFLAYRELQLDALHPVWYLAGAVALAICFSLLWLNRTPYPGLRPWRRTAA